jgi:6-pyruvoyltetrahydropterin/6-carboxytetrahydropterin synthase
LEVSVAGPLDNVSGQVVNVPALDRLVNEQILRDFDHRYFNADVPEFSSDLVPTSENILRVIENRLRAGWRKTFAGDWPRLEGIRLQETKRNRFELRTN